ncbi:MAG: hypothetical protein ACE5JS_03555 [Nitrospinota bacterium]
MLKDAGGALQRLIAVKKRVPGIVLRLTSRMTRSKLKSSMAACPSRAEQPEALERLT